MIEQPEFGIIDEDVERIRREEAQMHEMQLNGLQAAIIGVVAYNGLSCGLTGEHLRYRRLFGMGILDNVGFPWF